MEIKLKNNVDQLKTNLISRPLAIYIHYPFCKSKCPYCDFNSHVYQEVDHQRFLAAYLQEIDYFSSQLKNRKVISVFFGGGTPSLMKVSTAEKIIEKISANFAMDKNCEITIEANPTSFESDKFFDFKKIGINRLSLGIQALNDSDLKFLGRNHSKEESIAVIKNAAKIFDNFSFDLIYARPNQSIKSWISELKEAFQFGSKHLSLYQLTIEKGTQFFSDFARKKFILPDEEMSISLYEITNEICAINGFEMYEISNYSKKNFECLHNLNYWQGGDYLGIGAGAHSRLFFDNSFDRSALMMRHEPTLWLNKVENERNGIQTDEKISKTEMLEELILMGLRLKKGINNLIFQQLFSKTIADLFELNKLKMLEEQGLIELDNDSIKIPETKMILANAIILKVCSAIS